METTGPPTLQTTLTILALIVLTGGLVAFGVARWLRRRSIPAAGRSQPANAARPSQGELLLRQQNAYLEALYDTTFDLISNLDLEVLLENIVRRAGNSLGTEHGFVDLVEPGRDHLEPKVSIGILKETSYFKARRGEGLSGKVWQEARPIVIEDYDTWAGRLPEFSHQRAGAMVGIPLLARARVIGVLGLAYPAGSGKTFQPEDVQFLEQFAHLAAVALDNAYLFSATTELLEQEQHLKELAQLLSSSLDLSKTLDTFMRLTVQLVNAEAGLLGVFNQDSNNLSYPYQNNLPPDLFLPGDIESAARFWQTGRGSPQRFSLMDSTPLIVQPEWSQAGIQHQIAVQVSAGREQIGVLWLFRLAAEKPFSEQHASLAQAAAQQAALAIQNARRFKNEHTRRLRQTALFRLSTRLAATYTENEIWQQVAEGLHDPQLNYTYIVLLELDTATGERVIRGHVGWSNDWLGRRLVPGQGISERPLLDGQPHYTPDVTQEPNYFDGLGKGSEADIPIWVEKEMVGVLSIEIDQPYAFSAEDMEVFIAAANQAGLALGQARLYTQLQKELAERQRAENDLRGANQSLIQQIAEIEALQIQLREQVIRDPLTGLFNRRYLRETLPREIANAIREGYPIGIMIMDVDHFKQINDTYGHDAGDFVLERLGNLLTHETRAGDIVCRYGGEEIVIVLPRASLEHTRRRAEDIRQLFGTNPTTYKDQEINAQVSIGVAAFPRDGRSGDEILIKADRALYSAKQNGRNRVHIYQPAD